MSRGSTNWIALSFLLAALLLALGGCRQSSETAKYNQNSGVDGRRDTAPRIYLGTSEDDHCDSKGGDNEDWKKIHVRDPGILRVSVGIDNSSGLDADLFLHDGFGRAIDRLRVNGNDDFYEFRPLPVTTGRYYFRIACNEGSSVYTVAVTHTADRPENIEPSRVYVLREERKPEPQRPKSTRRSKRRRPAATAGGGADPAASQPPKTSPKTPPQDPATTTPPPPPAEDPSAAAQRLDNPLEVKGVAAQQDPTVEVVAPPLPEDLKPIEGTIILITPTPGGDDITVTIRGIGTEYSVSEDMVGSATLPGGRRVDVRLFKCEEKRCYGRVSAAPADFDPEESRRVQFIPKTQRR